MLPPPPSPQTIFASRAYPRTGPVTWIALRDDRTQHAKRPLVMSCHAGWERQTDLCTRHLSAKGGGGVFRLLSLSGVVFRLALCGRGAERGRGLGLPWWRFLSCSFSLLSHIFYSRSISISCVITCGRKVALAWLAWVTSVAFFPVHQGLAWRPSSIKARCPEGARRVDGFVSHYQKPPVVFCVLCLIVGVLRSCSRRSR